jgi:ubiquinone/menaquinone biosynthesis C-methylase UbiE
MNEEQEIALAKFLLHLNNNYDAIKSYMSSGVDPKWIRNAAAEQGVELTPQETLDCIEVIRSGIKYIERQNEQ